MTRHADADRPSHARVVKRREADLAFLERVRTASREELWQMHDDHRRGPQWKRVAIARRIRMAEGGNEMTTTVTIDRDVLQATFDTAVGSMDFTSGFLDDEEVVALRACAVALGVDPMVATPPNFECKYRGWHRWWIPSDRTTEWVRGGTHLAGPRDPDVMTRTCLACRHKEQRPRTDEDRVVVP